MRLDGDLEIHKDATARIGNESALGKKYIDLDTGSQKAGSLGDGVIPPKQTGSAQGLDDVFEPFDAQARKGLQTALREVGGGMSGHAGDLNRSEEHTSELQSLMRISYAVFCLK